MLPFVMLGVLLVSFQAEAGDARRDAKNIVRQSLQKKAAVKNLDAFKKPPTPFHGFNVAREEIANAANLIGVDDCGGCKVMKDASPQEAFTEPPLEDENELLVFVSFSMGEQNLKALLQQVSAARAKGINVRAVLRGLINNSWRQTHEKLLSLQESLQIDPVAFDRHGVRVVPTFVQGPHRLAGNVSVSYVLSAFDKLGSRS